MSKKPLSLSVRRSKIAQLGKFAATHAALEKASALSHKAYGLLIKELRLGAAGEFRVRGNPGYPLLVKAWHASVAIDAIIAELEAAAARAKGTAA